MKINNKAIKGIFMSFKYASSEITSNILNIGMSHIDMGIEITPSIRQLEISFENKLDISEFISIVTKPFSLDIEDGFSYDCIIYSTPSITMYTENQGTVNVLLSTICKGEMIAETGLNFTVLGNYDTECIIEVTSKIDIDEFTINNYCIKGLQAQKTFVIDGIHKLVYYKDTPEISTYDNTNLKYFPKLEIGENKISTSHPIDLKVSYYPIYL